MARITLADHKTSFSTRVATILPEIDSTTQTLRLRLDVNNRDLRLRPGMFVDVDLSVAVPAGLSVPADAVLDSGLAKRVFVDRGHGFFEPHQVETGERFGDRVQILSGLTEGERVVDKGTFLVDSESRLRTAAAGIQPAAVHHASTP